MSTNVHVNAHSQSQSRQSHIPDIPILPQNQPAILFTHTRTVVRKGTYALRVVVHTITLIVLIAIADVCLLGALLVKLGNARWGWKVSSAIANQFWSFMQGYFEISRNALPAIIVTGDELPSGEAAIVMSNHLSYADFYLTQHLAVRAKMLPSCRYFAKRELVWMIPLFGWAFWAMDMILVSRNWTKDSDSISRAFARIKQHAQPAWIGLCPEGTRLSIPKLRASQAFSKKHDKPVLRHLLWPRTRGMVATVQGMRENVGAVYDLTLLYVTPARTVGRGKEAGAGSGKGNKNGNEKGATGGKEGLGGARSGRVPSLAEMVGVGDLSREGYEFMIHVRRFPINELPQDDEEIRQWCEDRWVEKDGILAGMRRDAGLENEEGEGEEGQEEEGTGVENKLRKRKTVNGSRK